MQLIDNTQQKVADRFANNKPKISIVIPTYNHLEDCLRPCLQSIIANTDLTEVEIVVVANGCIDGTRNYLDSLGDIVTTIWIEQPAGYTVATNAGIKAARGEYIVLLNNDVVIYGNGKNSFWLSILLDPFVTQANVGITGAAKNYHDGTDRDFLLFFCVMLSRKMVDEIGFLDEVFNPGYGEDIDYCHRARAYGYQVLQVPNDVTYDKLRRYDDHVLQFPLYHPGSKTVHEVTGWNEIVDRNEKILRERYIANKVIVDAQSASMDATQVENFIAQIVNRGMIAPESLPDGWFSPWDTNTYARLLMQLPQNSSFAEIGVWQGRSLCSVADVIKCKNLQVFAIDTFAGTKNEEAHTEALATGLDLASKFSKHISEFQITKHITTFNCTSKDAASSISDNSLDLVFIDGDHSRYGLLQDIYSYYYKLKDNAIMLGHDYTWTEVAELVHELFQNNVAIEANMWYVRKQDIDINKVHQLLEAKIKYSIVIPTYNHLEDCLRPCLQSILDNTFVSNYEIIVVANGCNDATKEYLSTLPSIVKSVWVDEQLGYVKATNLGIQKAQGEYIVLLNNDTCILGADWIPILEKPFADPKVAISGPRKAYSEIVKAEYMLFFCVMIARRVIEEIGVLDENFGIGYHEDVDFCYRCIKNGYKLTEVPQDIAYDEQSKGDANRGGNFPIYHKGGGTFAEIFGNSSERLDANIKYIKNKHAIIDLPDGWFGQPDIDVYSSLISRLPRYGTFAEIGVWQGRSLCSVASLIKEKQLNVHAIDTFQGNPGEEDHVKILSTKNVEEAFRNNILKFNINSNVTVHSKSSVTASSLIADQSLDFAFIDADHSYEAVVSDIAAWLPKIKNGGCIAGHDFMYSDNVRRAVQEAFGNNFRVESNLWYVMNIQNKYAKKFTIGYIDSNPTAFAQYLKPCLDRLDQSMVDVISMPMSSCAASNYNKILEQARSKYVIFVHQDVGFGRDFLDAVNKSIEKQPNFGAMGIVGFDKDLHTIWSNDQGMYEVNFFDSMCLIINKEHGIKFDEIYFDDLHMYVEDYCMQAKNLGYKSYTLQYPSFQFDGDDVFNFEARYFKHIGLTYKENNNSMWGKYNDYYQKFLQKWQRSTVYDCFMFFNELDILDIRMHELNDVVDYFVLVESTLTHQGNKKPLYFAENKNRYGKFLHKIIHIVVDDMPETIDPWVREAYQRNCIYRGISNCKPNDVIIVSDVDEIPKSKVISDYRISQGLTCVEIDLFYYKLNYLVTNTKWYKLRIFPFSLVKDGDVQKIRGEQDYNYQTMIKNGGWHFSYFGDANHIRQKLESYGHIEYNNEAIKNEQYMLKCINNGQDILGRGINLQICPIDSNYPKYVCDNIDYYKSKKLVAMTEKFVWDTIKNKMKHFDSDTYNEIYNIDVYNMLASEIQNKIVVDIGAHKGIFSLRCMELGAKNAYLFEPNINNFNQLQQICKPEMNLNCHNVGVLDGSISECKISDANMGSSIYSSDAVLNAKMISMQDAVSLISEYKDEWILKLDCEGSEFEIIYNTPQEIIKRFVFIYIEIHDEMNPKYMHGETALLKYLNDLGFDVAFTAPPFGLFTFDGRFFPTPVKTLKLKNRNVTDIKNYNDNQDKFDYKLIDQAYADMGNHIISAYDAKNYKSVPQKMLCNLTSLDCADESISLVFAKNILLEEKINLSLPEDTDRFKQIFCELNRCMIDDGKIYIRTDDGGRDEYVKVLINNGFANISAFYHSNYTYICANKASKKPPKRKNVDVSIVIPTYNHLEDCLKPCIESIIRNTDMSKVEVVVVANGCVDGTRQYIESLGEPFKLVWIDEAAGYPRATNAGIRAASGEYILLLNNDTLILDNAARHEWIDCMKNPFLTQEKVGITGPLKGTCPFVEGNETEGTPFMIFFCVMMRKDLFDVLGMLDEDFAPGGGEDTAFSWKALQAGYQLVQVPTEGNLHTGTKYGLGSFPIFHNPGSTRGDDWNLNKRNNLKLMKKFRTKSLKLQFSDNFQDLGYFMVSKVNQFATLDLDPTNIDLTNESVTAIIIQNQYTISNVSEFIAECSRVLRVSCPLKIYVKPEERKYVEYLFSQNNLVLQSYVQVDDKILMESVKADTQKPKIYDCFSFFNELDVLEIRLNELYDHVDHFVLSEMTKTHQGDMKPLYFAQNKNRFAKFLDKIIHIVVDDCPSTEDPWIREHYQRNCLARGLANCKDNDFVIVSDVDEIPRASKIKEYDGKKDWMYFEQTQYNFYLNCEAKQFDAAPGIHSRITTFGLMKRYNLNATDIRYRPINSSQRIADGGWHFTWLGGSKKIVEKLESFAHKEINLDQHKNLNSIQKNIDANIDAFGRSNEKTSKFVVIDESFPAWITNNAQMYTDKKYIKQMSQNGKVAIVMPYYNDASFIDKSVDAIIKQNYKDWELFIVDDGSDMNLAARNILKSNDSRIHLLEKSNAGPSSARNLALNRIAASNFDYVAYCDADDVWPVDYLQKQLTNLQSCDISYCAADTYFADGSVAVPYGIPNPNEWPGLEYMLQTPFIFISGVVHRIECLNVGLFDEQLDSIEDWDMWARMAEADYKFIKNQNVKIIYTVKTAGNMASKRSEEKYNKFKIKHGLMQNAK